MLPYVGSRMDMRNPSGQVAVYQHGNAISMSRMTGPGDYAHQVTMEDELEEQVSSIDNGMNILLVLVDPGEGNVTWLTRR